MNKEKEFERLRAALAASKKEIKSLTGKLERSRNKVSRQKAALKKKETETIELTDGQSESLSSLLPGIDIMNLLSD